MLACQPSNPGEELFLKYDDYEFNFQKEEYPNNERFVRKMENMLRQGEYEQVLPLLDNWINDHEYDFEKIYAKGVAELRLGQHQKALSTFRYLRSLGPQFFNEMDWYQALAHIKMGELNEAVPFLKEIQSIHPRYEHVEELLNIIAQHK